MSEKEQLERQMWGHAVNGLCTLVALLGRCWRGDATDGHHTANVEHIVNEWSAGSKINEELKKL